MTTFQAPRDGLFVAMLVSFAAHSLLLTLGIRSLPTPSSPSGAHNKPLFLSSRQVFSLNKGSTSPAQTQSQATQGLETSVVKKELSKPSAHEDAVEPPTPTTVPLDQNLVAKPELNTDESGSVLPNLLSEPIFPGGSPNRGSWGQRSGPAANQVKLQGNRGPAFVVPFLRSITSQLPPNTRCDVQVSETWTTAHVSCTDNSFDSLITGYLSQQLQIVKSLPNAGFCFQVKPSDFNAVSCY